MNKSSPFVAVGKVLGAVACIAVLGYLAACGGEGSGSDETQQFGRLRLRAEVSSRLRPGLFHASGRPGYTARNR